MEEPRPGVKIVSPLWKDYRKIHDHSTLSQASAAKALLSFYGLPALEAPDFRKESYAAPDGSAYRDQLGVVIGPGATIHSHSRCYGMEFSEAEVTRAIAAILSADESVFLADHKRDLPAGGTPLYKRLIKDPDFIAACRSNDKESQMAIGLHSLKLERRIDDLMISEEVGREPATDVADLDMKDAMSAIEELMSLKRGEMPRLYLSRDMLAARAKGDERPALDLALSIIDSKKHPVQPEDEIEILADGSEGLPPVPELPEPFQPAPPDYDALIDAARRSWIPPAAPAEGEAGLTVPVGQAPVAGEKEIVALPEPTYDETALKGKMVSSIQEMVEIALALPDDRKQKMPDLLAEAEDIAASLYDEARYNERMAYLDSQIVPAEDHGNRMERIAVKRLVPAILAYNDSLAKMSRMSQEKKTLDIERGALTLPMTPQARAMAEDLAASEWMLQRYYGTEYPAPSFLHSLAALQTVHLFTGMGFADSAETVVNHFQAQCQNTLAAAEKVILSDRESELMKRIPPMGMEEAKRAASEDVDFVRSMLRWHTKRGKPEWSEAASEMADTKRMAEIMAANPSQNPGWAAFAVADEMAQTRAVFNSSSFPAVYCRPLSCLSINYSRKAITMYAKEIVASGADLSFPISNDPWDKELEALLPKNENAWDKVSPHIRRVARTLNIFLYMESSPEQRKRLWGETAPGMAATLPPNASKPQAPKDADIQKATKADEASTQKEVRMPSQSMLEGMSQPEREMVSMVVGAPFSERTLYNFLNMHPGVRQLRMDRVVADAWLAEDWRRMVESTRQARKSAYVSCALKEPTTAEMLDAMGDPANLAKEQAELVASFFRIAKEKVTPFEIRAFGTWARGNQNELVSFWKSNYPEPEDVSNLIFMMESGVSQFDGKEAALLQNLLRKEPSAMGSDNTRKIESLKRVYEDLLEFRVSWFFADHAQRQSQWRRNEIDLITAADSAHKVRFMKDVVLTPEEKELLGALAGTTGLKAFEDISAERRDEIRKSFAAHIEQGDYGVVYRQEIMTLASFGESMEASSLRAAARKEEMFNSLLDAFEAKRSSVDARQHDSVAVSVPKLGKDGANLQNEDSYSSFRILEADGSVITLSAVFDGMGGESKGQWGDKTNAQRASGIAKDAFDACALAAWIRTPEDARRALMMADLAIVMEQMKSHSGAERSRRTTHRRISSATRWAPPRR